ncbi:hypothetical protein PM3016_2654 [Paenibacillus mucilaginosus 3016]|uniref:Uncharacterized protein n=1 Tax=Paenibacillus mucilaginosus 3016 TaxID=1116391 RepID=H6NFC5_9BACL|nr:hypothetical protein PM3016_2654 [Paenibacillus mucilaginosus 3016]
MRLWPARKHSLYPPVPQAAPIVALQSLPPQRGCSRSVPRICAVSGPLPHSFPTHRLASLRHGCGLCYVPRSRPVPSLQPSLLQLSIRASLIPVPPPRPPPARLQPSPLRPRSAVLLRFAQSFTHSFHSPCSCTCSGSPRKPGGTAPQSGGSSGTPRPARPPAQCGRCGGAAGRPAGPACGSASR